MGESSFAFEALEEGGNADVGEMVFGEVLEEIPSALEEADAATDTRF
jgi:hypothetical protein